MQRTRSNSQGPQHEPQPKQFEELAKLASRTAEQDWSPGYSLSEWGRLQRQLVSEGRVYKSEGAIDLAFLRYGTVFHLCRDIIPSSHPDWSTCSPTVRASFNRTADSAAQQLEELKRMIRARSEAFSHARAAVAKGSSPALTLRNTVLPAATSMSSTPDSDILLKKLAASQKEAKKRLFKRAFGVGKKKGGSSSPSLGTLAEPGTSETTDDERESDSPREMPNREQQDRPLSDGRGAVIRRRPATNDRLQQQQYPQSHQGPTRLQRRSHGPQLKLPGEEDSDEEPPAAIEYAGGSNYSREQPYSSFFPNGTRPPPPESNLTPAYPPAPSSSVSGPIHSTHSAPANYYNPPPHQQQPRSSPSFAPSFPATPQAWPSHHSSELPIARAPPPGLVRAPSRLTTSHQQQQGYSPSPYAARPPLPEHSRSYDSSSASRGSWNQQSMLSHAPPPRPPELPSVPPPAGYPHAQSRQSSLQYPQSSIPGAAYPNPQPPRPPQPPSSYARPLPSAASFPPSAPPSSSSSGLTRRSSSVAALPLDLLGGRGSAVARQGLDGMGSMKGALEEDFLGVTEGGQPLRNLVLPSTLVDHFVAIASSNTDKGIETCGFLLGGLSHNTFTISHLLIPKQDGTPDTCMTTDEEGVFKFQDDRDLMTLGWIHTHPTQTCFMSSLDLHTHASYQLTLAEAIAVVCAPSQDPSVGIFRLTDPPGLETIIKCKQSSLFHPHEDLPIYSDVDPSWGHCRMRNIPFESVDLRG